MSILGVDVSHFQGFPNFAQVKASGREFAIHKATEGTTYVDPNCAKNRAAARAAGLVVGLYHFARAGNAAAEAAWFVKAVGALQPGEFLVLDQEVPNSIAWCKAWLDAVYAATGVRPFVYMNQSASTGMTMGDWSGVAAKYALWLAKYDNSTAQPTVAYWGAPAMKQFSDKGAVPGISGGVDVDVFYGTRDQLLAYGKGGATINPGDDMALTDDDLRKLSDAVWFGTSGAKLLPNGSTGGSEWAYTTLGWLQERIRRDVVAELAKVAPAAAPAASVDATAVAAALASNQSFLAAIAVAVADENARRQAS